MSFVQRPGERQMQRVDRKVQDLHEGLRIRAPLVAKHAHFIVETFPGGVNRLYI